MKSLNLKLNFLSLLALVLSTSFCYSQEGQVTVNQDKKIDALLNIKKEINKTENHSDRYKIQIYSGNRSGAQHAQSEFNSTFSGWYSTDVYEPPNFKIWVGNYRTRLEADRALQRVKKKFPSAFIFKPKKQ